MRQTWIPWLGRAARRRARAEAAAAAEQERERAAAVRRALEAARRNEPPPWDGPTQRLANLPLLTPGQLHRTRTGRWR